MIDVRVNGVAHSLEVTPTESAVEVLRDRLHLSGTKYVCGSGACGACTVLVDGTPVVSCLLPSHALDGHEVTTIEGIGSELHPVQKAFMACDALQCGFCTPGYVMEGVAFYDEWQREHQGCKPSKEEVAERFSGHLCRCGAYPGMITAIREACGGAYEGAACSSPRKEARAKVTGQARYTTDILYPEQLEGRILRSPYPHARLLRLDYTKALALPGVKSVVELFPKDKTLCYIGQEIAAVAATTREIAQQALALIDVQYEAQESVTSSLAARKSEAPQVYHFPYGKAPNAGESPLFPSKWKGNVRGPNTFFARQPGKARRLIQQARQQASPNLLESTWTTQSISHTAFEPHACVASWSADKTLTVHLSTQSCARMAREIAKRWHLPLNHVQVLCEYIGGAFGSKIELTAEAVAAIELSLKTQTPVRVVLERDEEMAIGGYRPAVTVDLALLTEQSGNLEALSIEAYGESGIAIGSLVAGVCQAIYPGAPRNLADYDIVTHTPPGKPFRGPGGPSALWALEQSVDAMACHLKVDPLALREQWNPAPSLQELYSWVKTIPAWNNRLLLQTQSGPVRRGLGLAVGSWLYFLQPGTQVEIKVIQGHLKVQTASQDMGNGTRSMLAQVTAQAFGLSSDQIEVQLGNSQDVPGAASSGSRTTASFVSAVHDAAQQLQKQLLQVATREFQCKDPTIVPGGVASGDTFISWQEVFAVAPDLSALGKRQKDQRRYQMPFPIKGMQIGSGSSWGVCISDVEVDLRFGNVRVLRVWGGFAAGKIMVPALAQSQAYGGILQGIGYALHESRQHDPLTGMMLNTNLTDYHLLGMADTPEIETYFAEQGFEYVAGGAIGLAEITTLPVAASIGNAVYHATGWRPHHLPLQTQEVLAGLSKGRL